MTKSSPDGEDFVYEAVRVSDIPLTGRIVGIGPCGFIGRLRKNQTASLACGLERKKRAQIVIF